MGIFYPFMKKAGYGCRKGCDCCMVGALRGAIGLALALVVYSEHLRYDFNLIEGATDINKRQPFLFWIKTRLQN